MWGFTGTMGLLLAPKFLSLIAILGDRNERRGFGGAPGAFLSVLLETLLAGLLAPVTMLSQARDVVLILLGHDSGWQAQRRDDGSIRPRVVVRHYAWHTLV